MNIVRILKKIQQMERRFQTVKIDEPTAECTVDIIKGLCGKYEERQ